GAWGLYFGAEKRRILLIFKATCSINYKVNGLEGKIPFSPNPLLAFLRNQATLLKSGEALISERQGSL
ncbi:MAG: hypothetical protein V2A74_13355, partial [bacterium]